MKIKETYNSFVGIIDVGKLGFFIEVSNGGVDIGMDTLVKQASFYNRVVLIGEPLEQNDEITKFIAKVEAVSKGIMFEIHTDGMKKPSGFGKFGNLIFDVNLKLKKSDIEYEKRIDAGIIDWFNESKTRFIFDVQTQDDIDEVNLIVRGNNIKNYKVYLKPIFNSQKDIDFVIKYAKLYKHNIAPDIREMLWKDDGRQF